MGTGESAMPNGVAPHARELLASEARAILAASAAPKSIEPSPTTVGLFSKEDGDVIMVALDDGEISRRLP